MRRRYVPRAIPGPLVNAKAGGTKVWWRALLVCGVLVPPLLMVSCSTTTETPKSSAKMPQPPRCLEAHLSLSLINTGNGGGSVIWIGTFENQGPHPCTLKGFPGFQMLGAGNVLLSTSVTYQNPGLHPKGPAEIDLGQGEAASFTILVSDGGQSLPSLPACAAAGAVVVTPPGGGTGIEIVAPPGLIAYPNYQGGPCGVVYVGALLAGSAQRAQCPGCFPAPPPGESVTSNTVKIPEHRPVGSPTYWHWLERR
jgi:Protein of unknown function (DUF4232)